MREKIGKVPDDFTVNLLLLLLEWNCIFIYTKHNSF